ncbi:hypothetical protein LZC95_34800 [Pendulispora brunnea]|uniref:TolB protein n=1 Tax=Pendulispora brunnea TaxID=2905690 RepID=A0ABZ2JZ20_9BACT
MRADPRTMFVMAMVAAACHRESPAPPKHDAKPLAKPADSSPAPAADLTRADGARRLAIPLAGSLQNPCWSPDGRELVLTRFAGGYNEGLALVGRVSAADGTPLAWGKAEAQDVNLPGACWNAALQRVAVSSDVAVHDEIYLVDPQSGQRTQVTRRRDAEAREPSISPDGQFLVFESHPVGSEKYGSIWRVSTDGGGLVRLTNGRGNDRQPNWSPAGDCILFQSARSGNHDIYTIDPSGRSLKNVTHSPAEDTDAAWSPDGTHIVYSSDEGGLEHPNLFIVTRDGSRRIRVTRHRGYDGAPSWSPDGRSIAFESSDGDPDANGTRIYVIATPPLP